MVATVKRCERVYKRTDEPNVKCYCEKNRVRKSAARRNRVPAKPNRFCGMEERQPIKAKPYFYKKYGKPKGLPRRGGDGGN